MPSHELLIAFAATTAIFAYIPGPAMLYAAARTVAGGRSAGLMAAPGNICARPAAPFSSASDCGLPWKNPDRA